MTRNTIIEDNKEYWTIISEDEDHKSKNEKKNGELNKVQDNKLFYQHKFLRSKMTLVFDMIGTFIKVIDPRMHDIKNDNYKTNIFQDTVNVGDSVYLMSYLMKPFELRAWFRKMHEQYDLVIYSLLPKDLIEKVLDNINKVCSHEVRDFISQILGYEQLVFHQDWVVKDLSLLKNGSRFKEQEDENYD